MALDYNIELDGELLIVTTSGYDENVNDTVKYGEDILQACTESNCKKILVDESRMTGVLDKIGQYELVTRLAAIAPHDLKVAIVVNPDNYQETSFGTMVAENRGFKIDAFTSLDDAHVWLQLEE
jgi:hypothetical protein